MKKIIFLLLGFFALSGCNRADNTAKEQPSEIKTTVDILLNNWHKDAAEANYNQYFGLMDSISVFIGTDANENWTKKQFEEFCKPWFEKGKAWDFKVLERNIYVSKTAEFVWFDELLDTWMAFAEVRGCWKNRVTIGN